MKKLILITGAIVFIGNITGQKTTETVNVIIGGPIADYGDITGSVINIEDEPIVVEQTMKEFTITHSTFNNCFKTIYETGPVEVNQLTIQEINGIPPTTSEADIVQVIACDLGDDRITIEDIQRIPAVMGEMDISASIDVIPTTVFEVEYPDYYHPEMGNSQSQRSSQGPFTGLDGHNFIEDPAIIYPNPVRDVLNIKSTDPITVIEILGIHGQVELELDPRSTMDVSTLAAGTYYARIHFENIKDVQVEKILVVK